MKNSPNHIHEYRVPMDFLKERAISFWIICEYLQKVYQDDSEMQSFLGEDYLDELYQININLIEIIGKMELAEVDFEQKIHICHTIHLDGKDFKNIINHIDLSHLYRPLHSSIIHKWSKIFYAEKFISCTHCTIIATRSTFLQML